MSLKSLNNIFKGDKVIWMVFFLLCMISIVEVYSASSTLSYKGGNYWAPLLKHGGMLFIGFIVMIVVMNIKCRYFKIATLPALVLSVLMLIGVLLTGGVTNGASRWIEVMGIQFQPSELGKGALVLAVAQILSAMQTEAGAAKKAFKYILFLSAAIIIPISFESTAGKFNRAAYDVCGACAFKTNRKTLGCRGTDGGFCTCIGNGSRNR